MEIIGSYLDEPTEYPSITFKNVDGYGTLHFRVDVFDHLGHLNIDIVYGITIGERYGRIRVLDNEDITHFNYPLPDHLKELIVSYYQHDERYQDILPWVVEHLPAMLLEQLL